MMLTLIITFGTISLVGAYFLGSWLDKKEKEFVRKEPLLKR